jgi:hypothetical protein
MDLPTVLLRHELPDGSSHVDWMIAPDEDAKLITFRLERPVHALAPGEVLRAERIGEHRRLYLEHEGPLPGETDRGSVQRIARGSVRAWTAAHPDSWTLTIRWTSGGGAQVLLLEADEAPWWHVTAVSVTPGNAPV